jgi:ribosome recycling factor
MAYDLNTLKKGIEGTKEWLVTELAALRTGRATPALLDGVTLEVYGSRMKLKEVGSVSVQDARTLYVTPWDVGQVKAIEKAITVADLGVSVGADEKGVRVSFPELTAERRAQLVRLLKSKLEEARVTLRGKRTEHMNAVEKLEKDGAMGEDEMRRTKEAIQKLIDEGNKSFEVLADKKEEELSQ